MDEAGVKQWMAGDLGVSRETLDKLDRYAALIADEQSRQNLVSARTLPDLWDRHFRDSAQLLTLAPEAARGGTWLDLGSGAGLPGLVLAILGDMRMTLVESRTLRQQFLAAMIAELALEDRVELVADRLERMPDRPFSVITARAFAPLPKLLALAHRFSTERTVWLLPKGKTVEDELAETRRLWHGEFEKVPSLTHDSFIVRTTGIRPRRRR